MHGVPRWHVWRDHCVELVELQWQLPRWLHLRHRDFNSSGVSCRAVQPGRGEQLLRLSRWHVWCNHRVKFVELQWQLHRGLLLLSWLDHRDCCCLHCWLLLSCWVDQRDGGGHVSCRAVQLGWCRELHQLLRRPNQYRGVVVVRYCVPGWSVRHVVVQPVPSGSVRRGDWLDDQCVQRQLCRGVLLSRGLHQRDSGRLCGRAVQRSRRWHVVHQLHCGSVLTVTRCLDLSVVRQWHIECNRVVCVYSNNCDAAVGLFRRYSVDV